MFSKRLIMFQTGILLAVSSCVWRDVTEGEPVNLSFQDDDTVVLIDPNAPALPALADPAKPGTVQQMAKVAPAPTKPVSEKIEKEEVENSIAEAVAPEKVLEPDGVGPSTADVEVVAAEPPRSVDELIRHKRASGYFITIGSGPQVRFIKAAQLNVRILPDRYSKMLGLLYGGDEVHVTIRGDWAKLDEGRWIRSRWLVKKRPKGFKGGPPEEAQVAMESDSEAGHRVTTNGVRSHLQDPLVQTR